MRILLTADCWIPVPPIYYGGIERIIDMLIGGLQEHGHDVTLIAHPDSKSSCQLLPYPSTDPADKWGQLRNMRVVYDAVRNRSFDVLHSFGRLAYMLPLLPARIPKIMSYQREPTLRMIKYAIRLARPGTLVFTGCSNYISDQIAPIAPAYTVYNGVDLDRYTFVEQVPNNAPLMFLGRIEPIKGAHTAIRAAKASGRRLILAGNVPPEAKSYFDTEIKPHIDGRQIEYVGPVDDVTKNRLLGQSAALLMPIEWNEPFGIVMAEALACGTPVVGYPQGAVREVIKDGHNGFLTSDLKQLMQGITAINQIPRANCRRSCENRFAANVIVGKYEKLYRQLIGLA